MQPHDPGPVHELSQGLDEQTMGRNGDSGVGAAEQRSGAGENVDFRICRLAVGIHQVQLQASDRGQPGAGEPEVGARTTAERGRQPPRSRLLYRKRAGHQSGGPDNHAASRRTAEHLAPGGRLAAARHQARPGGCHRDGCPGQYARPSKGDQRSAVLGAARRRQAAHHSRPLACRASTCRAGLPGAGSARDDGDPPAAWLPAASATG